MSVSVNEYVVHDVCIMCTDAVVGVNACIFVLFVEKVCIMCTTASGTVCENKCPLLKTMKNES